MSLRALRRNIYGENEHAEHQVVFHFGRAMQVYKPATESITRSSVNGFDQRAEIIDHIAKRMPGLYGHLAALRQKLQVIPLSKFVRPALVASVPKASYHYFGRFLETGEFFGFPREGLRDS